MKRNSSARIPATSAPGGLESAARLAACPMRPKNYAPRSLRSAAWATSRSSSGTAVRAFPDRSDPDKMPDPFHDAVAVGLATSSAASESPPGRGRTSGVTCSHEISHFLLMPQYEPLLEALGEHVEIRILTYHYGTQNLPHEPVADIVLAWEANLGAEDRVMLIREAVRPLCSPGYAETHADILNGPVSGWSGITFLDLTRPNQGWLWRLVQGRRPAVTKHGNRVSTATSTCWTRLPAGAASTGLKHWIERYLDSGALSNSPTASWITTTIFAACSPRRGEEIPSRKNAWSSLSTRQGIPRRSQTNERRCAAGPVLRPWFFPRRGAHGMPGAG